MKKKWIFLALSIFVVAVLAASVCFSAYWANAARELYISLVELAEQYSSARVDADYHFSLFVLYLSFTVLQLLALIASVCGLIYIIKADFTLSKEERELKAKEIAEQRKQAKKEKLQAKLDELNKE